LGLGGHFRSQLGLTSVFFGLVWVAFGSRIERDQNKTEKDPNETVKTAIRPRRDSFEIPTTRPIFATSIRVYKI
jgi:hypothetical protein